MPRFHLHIVEDERVVKDEEGQEFSEDEAVRKEAVETGASIARDAFIRGSASRVIVAKRSKTFLQGDHFPHTRRVKRT
jgi:hypothetical protein